MATSAETAIQDHFAACELMYQLMLDENRHLKNSNSPPGDDFLGLKRSVLTQLDDALIALRNVGALPDALPASLKATVTKSQQLVMKAMLLDRENEQLLRKCTAAESRKQITQPNVRPTLEQIQRLYSKHSTPPPTDVGLIEE